MYYLCSENKGPDQLCGYRTADLRLCFRICKKPVFSRRGSYSRSYANQATFSVLMDFVNFDFISNVDPLYVVEHDFDIIKYFKINLSKFVRNMQLLS